jgi:hypothetical protein
MTQLPTLAGRDDGLGPLPWRHLSERASRLKGQLNVGETTPDDGSNSLEEDLVVRR